MDHLPPSSVTADQRADDLDILFPKPSSDVLSTQASEFSPMVMEGFNMMYGSNQNRTSTGSKKATSSFGFAQSSSRSHINGTTTSDAIDINVNSAAYTSSSSGGMVSKKSSLSILPPSVVPKTISGSPLQHQLQIQREEEAYHRLSTPNHHHQHSSGAMLSTSPPPMMMAGRPSSSAAAAAAGVAAASSRPAGFAPGQVTADDGNLHVTGYDGIITTEQTLRDLFEPFVVVVEVVMKKTSGDFYFAFVNTHDPAGASQARLALNGARMQDGCILNVRKAQRKSKSQQQLQQQQQLNGTTKIEPSFTISATSTTVVSTTTASLHYHHQQQQQQQQQQQTAALAGNSSSVLGAEQQGEWYPNNGYHAQPFGKGNSEYENGDKPSRSYSPPQLAPQQHQQLVSSSYVLMQESAAGGGFNNNNNHHSQEEEVYDPEFHSGSPLPSHHRVPSHHRQQEQQQLQHSGPVIMDDQGNVATKNLFVTGYGPGPHVEEQLRMLFEQHTEVLACVEKKGGFCFVNTTQKQGAVEARIALKGKVINGGSLRINFAKERGRLGTSFDLTYNGRGRYQQQQQQQQQHNHPSVGLGALASPPSMITTPPMPLLSSSPPSQNVSSSSSPPSSSSYSLQQQQQQQQQQQYAYHSTTSNTTTTQSHSFNNLYQPVVMSGVQQHQQPQGSTAASSLQPPPSQLPPPRYHFQEQHQHYSFDGNGGMDYYHRSAVGDVNPFQQSRPSTSLPPWNS